LVGHQGGEPKISQLDFGNNINSGWLRFPAPTSGDRLVPKEPEYLSSVSWKETILGKIPTELQPLVYAYLRAILKSNGNGNPLQLVV
jgi:hypothetical protein